MQNTRTTRPLSRLVAGALAAGSASVLLAGALTLPAAAAPAPPPYATTVTITMSAPTFVTGEPVTFTGKVSAGTHGTPGGQLAFTVTGSDLSTVNCENNDTVALSGGTATCTVPGGLFVASGPYTVAAAYTDTVDSNYKPGSGSRTVNVNLGRTTTTVTASADPTVTGQSVTFNAAVAPISPAVGSPSGWVTFSGVTCDGGTDTIGVTQGVAQCTISGGLMSQTGAIAVSGAYSGDTDFQPSSGIAHQMVKPAALGVTVTPSTGTCTGDLCTIGQGTAVSFTATAAPTGTDGGSGTPQGTVVFTITPPGSHASMSCDGGNNSFTLSAGQGTCSFAAGLSASIYFEVTATVTAPGYTTASATIYENSDLTGTDLVTSVPRNIGTGQTFAVTAVVSPAGGYTGSNVPTGFVNVLVCGNNNNGNDGCQGGAVPVGAGGAATFTVGGGEYIGVYSYAAVYTGDTNFYSSTARAKYMAIGKSTTTTTLSESGGFASYDGDAVAITATVSAPDGAAGSTLIGPPTGNVTFTITGPDGTVDCAGGDSIPLAEAPGQVEGSVSCYLPPGTLTDSTPPATDYTVQVNYPGDSNYVASNGRAVQVVVPQPS